MRALGIRRGVRGPSASKSQGETGHPANTLREHETEKEFAQAVVELAQLHGWLVFRTWSSIHSPAGEPDLRLVRDRVIWAELKSERGHLTPEQGRAIQWLRDAGAEVYIWRPSDWHEILRVLKVGEP